MMIKYAAAVPRTLGTIDISALKKLSAVALPSSSTPFIPNSGFTFISQLTDFCFFKYQNFITLRIDFIFKNVNSLFYFFTKNKQKFVIRRKIQNTTSKFDKL